MQKPHLSILVLCHNSSSKVDKLFKNLSEVKNDFIELVFVDDGSKDDTVTKIKRIFSSINDVKIINQQHLGIFESRLNAIKNATGRYLTFLDDDDELQLEAIDWFFKNIKLDYDIYQFLYKKGENIRGNFSDFSLVNSKKDIFKTAYPYCWGTIFKKELFPELNWENCSNIFLGEDAVINALITENAQNKYLVPIVLYFYNRNSESITTKKQSFDKFSNLNHIHLVLEYFLSINAPKEAVDFILANYEHLIFFNLNNIIKNKTAKKDEKIALLNKMFWKNDIKYHIIPFIKENKKKKYRIHLLELRLLLKNRFKLFYKIYNLFAKSK